MRFCMRRGAAALLAVGFARQALAGEADLSQWSHVAPVEVAGSTAKGLLEFSIPPEVMAVGRPSLADLRLVGKSGEFIPYVLRTDQGSSWTDSLSPRLFNAIFVPGKESSVTADFGAKAIRTRIEIDTAGTNFRRLVQIEASQDGSTWSMLKASDWLFRVKDEQGEYNKSQVSLPDNDFRYLRVTVFNAPDDAERVEIRGVTAWRVQATAPQTAGVPTRSVDVKQDGHVTTIDVDLGYENLPLCEVSAAFEDANFLRRVEVLGRNVRSRTIVEPVENSQPRKREVEEPWISTAIGSFYRFPGGEGLEPAAGLTLPFNGQYRYLQLRISNGDNAPLKFTGLKVKRLQEYIDFRADAAGPLQLFAGNAEANRPEYDLENFADRLRAQGVEPAALGPLAMNPQFAAKIEIAPWSERHAVLLWGGLIAVMAVLGGLVLKQMKRAKAPLT